MSDLFGVPSWHVAIELTAEGCRKLLRRIEGNGGHQSLLRKLGKQIHRYRILPADPIKLRLVCVKEDVERIIRYRKNYGGGGFQGRLDEPCRALLDLGDAVIQALGMRVDWGEDG